MPLPAKFSESKHLQDVVKDVVNKLVREEFKDPDNPDAVWEPSITTSKNSLRKACTHESKDSLVITICRLLVFYLIKGKIAELFPLVSQNETHNLSKGLSQWPQVTLYFIQDKDAVPTGRIPLALECSFRLIGETRTTFTQANALSLAQSIKREFVIAGKGITHDKGKLNGTYYQFDKGYKLNILCQRKEDAIDLVKRILRVRDHVYESDCFQLNNPEKDSENNPIGTITILGKESKKPRWRPTARVRFTHALLSFPNFSSQFPLVDVTGKYKDALVRH